MFEMMKLYEKNGGAAFPINTENVTFFGMTMRDYFAAKALAGLCANPGGPFQANDASGWSIVNCSVLDIARECYGLADAMLAERGDGT